MKTLQTREIKYNPVENTACYLALLCRKNHNLNDDA